MTIDKSHIHVSPFHTQDYVPHPRDHTFTDQKYEYYAKYPEAGGKVCTVHYLKPVRRWGVVHCVASTNMLAAGGDCCFTVSAFSVVTSILLMLTLL